MNATAPLSQNSWQYRQINASTPSLDYLSDGIISLVEEGHPVVAGTADLMYSNGLVKFAKAYPDRFFQFGISEQNMVSAASGMATCGLVPFVATFASFIGLLCCEQIRMDVAYSAQPVRLIGHHTGISLGFYGTSHHATEDIGTMRSIADLAIVSPADGPQLYAAIKASASYDKPIYFRIGRGRDPEIYSKDTVFTFGKAVEHVAGEDLTIIACGMAVKNALDAAYAMRAEGKSVGVIDMASIKPIDREAIIIAAERSKKILTVEEHNVLGGLGSAVAEVLADEGVPAKLKRHGIYDEYSLIAPPTHLYAHYKLDAPGIKSVADGFLRG